MSLALFQALCQSGLRIFTTKEARACAQEVHLNDAYVPEALFHLKQKGMIRSLHKGLYTISPEFLPGSPLHEYEIAMALASPAAIAHFSALHFHGLTDQPVANVYLLIPRLSGKGTSSRRTYQIQGVTYHATRVKEVFYCGIEKARFGESFIWITALERTLIEGLIRPRLCGGIREVFFAFERATGRMDQEKLFSYCATFGVAVAKRLGWVLQKLSYPEAVLKRFRQIPSRGFHKLDVSGPSHGTWNKEWKLLENV